MSDYEHLNPNDLSINSRLRRLAAREIGETENAIDVGHKYDAESENDDLLRKISDDPNLSVWPVVEYAVADMPAGYDDEVDSGDYDTPFGGVIDDEKLQTLELGSIDTLVRRFYAETGMVLDVGSIDDEIVSEHLGVDVCFSPEALLAILEKAQEICGSDMVRTSDLIKARNALDIEFAQAVQTRESLQDLKALGIDEDELMELYNASAFKLRATARLLSAPGLANYVKELKTRAYARGDSVLSLDEVMSGAMMRLAVDDSLAIAVAEGDTEALEILQSTLTSEKSPTDTAELNKRQMQLEMLSVFILRNRYRSPRPGEGFDDIPRIDDSHF